MSGKDRGGKEIVAYWLSILWTTSPRWLRDDTMPDQRDHEPLITDIDASIADAKKRNA